MPPDAEIDQKAKEILETTTNFIDSDKDPSNPFGPNYYYYPFYYKLYCKYTSVCQYVHLSQADQDSQLLSNQVYYYPILAMIFGGRLLISKYRMRIIQRFPNFIKRERLKTYAMSFFFASMFYKPLMMMTVCRYSEPIMRRNLQQAVNNGFRDYHIDRKTDGLERFMMRYIFGADFWSEWNRVDQVYSYYLKNEYQIVKPELEYAVSEEEIFPVLV